MLGGVPDGKGGEYTFKLTATPSMGDDCPGTLVASNHRVVPELSGQGDYSMDRVNLNTHTSADLRAIEHRVNTMPAATTEQPPPNSIYRTAL